MKQFLVLVVLSAGSALACAETPDTEHKWYWGAGAGYFDVDYDDGELPHMESSTYNMFLGYEFNSYLGVELQIEHVNTGRDFDDDGFVHEFGGQALSPALIVKYPLARENLFEVYARVGATYLNYEIAQPRLGGRVEDQAFQSNFGFGVRGNHLFAEYVNYGDREQLYLEQIRAGFRLWF